MGKTQEHSQTAHGADLHTLRHSAAHIMAQAVRRLYPNVKLAIGPPIDDGFYYDLDLNAQITEEDLPKIEAEMAKIVAEKAPFKQSFMSKLEALKFFGEQGEVYKREIIDGIPDDRVSIYTDGEFIDLCEGPHIPSTGDLKAFKLLAVAGAYWRGDEKNAQLQRIYGTAFHTQAELDAHLKRLEEAKRRDHRKLGRELDLFSVQELAGPGLIFWHPKGGIVRKILEDWMRDQYLKRGYALVYTPHVARADLWKTSGHYDFYADNMYTRMKLEDAEYQLKPMNCPFHILIYRDRQRSYRELPIRLGELGTVYRYERSGVMHGLLRVRGFTQDDAHIFCTPEQVEAEIVSCLEFAVDVLKTFGFTDYRAELSTWDGGASGKYDGTADQWALAERALSAACKRLGLDAAVHADEAAFYGPKIDVKLVDAIGRLWQLSTIQFDFTLPRRFGLEYIAEDGKMHQPLMVHRALYGSIERFFGILVEHYAGAFPVWLAPVQAVLIPITDAQIEYARQVADRLRAGGVRAHVDDRNEKMQARIRDAQLSQVPYMLVVGGREVTQHAVAVRHRREGDLGAMPIEACLARIQAEAGPPA